MKAKAIRASLLVAVLMICLSMAPPVSAREIITVTMANGGTYSVMAYNTTTRSHYTIEGTLSSDSHAITVPNGYGCTISVALDRAVGTRSLYEHQDPLNPIFEAVKKSTYILELVRIGTLSSTAPQSTVPGFGGSGGFTRQPPP